MSSAIDLAGAVPAVTAVVCGRATLGLTATELQRFLGRSGIGKASARDLPVAMATGADAATTVAGALVICQAAGVPILVTGGIGGVHFEPPFDESADLAELGRTPAIVVCAGAKSILDLPATLERLETLGVTVVGFGTTEFPGFFFHSTGLPLPAVVQNVEEVVRIFASQRSLARPSALLVVQPPPPHEALPRELVERAVRDAVKEARLAGIQGARSTPFLLGAIDRATEGRSLRTNVALLEQNAELAGRIAQALAGTSHGSVVPRRRGQPS
jgi:pseudouridine-5'-phosphate glycosidase